MKFRVILIGILFLQYCADFQKPLAPDVPSNNLLLIGTSDFTTGSLSAIDLSTYKIYTDIIPLHSDAVLRSSTNHFFAINRLGQDNISLLKSDQNWQPLYESSTGKKSNPYDIVVVDSNTALVALYGANYLLIVNPTDGSHKGTIDLSAYADSDGLPEVNSLKLQSGFIYVTLQRLNRSQINWSPAGISYLLKINASNLQIVASYVLPFTNPISRIEYYAANNSLIFAAPAQFASNAQLDGGVIEFSLTSESFLTSPITEQQANFEIVDVVIVNANLGYIVGLDLNRNSIFASFNPITHSIIKQIDSLSSLIGGYYTEILYYNNLIFLADRKATNPGIRIFNALTSLEITFSPLDVGLPPFSLEVWP